MTWFRKRRPPVPPHGHEEQAMATIEHGIDQVKPLVGDVLTALAYADAKDRQQVVLACLLNAYMTGRVDASADILATVKEHEQ